MMYHPPTARELAAAHIRDLTVQAGRSRLAALARRRPGPEASRAPGSRPALPRRRSGRRGQLKVQPPPEPGRHTPTPASPTRNEVLMRHPHSPALPVPAPPGPRWWNGSPGWSAAHRKTAVLGWLRPGTGASQKQQLEHPARRAVPSVRAVP